MKTFRVEPHNGSTTTCFVVFVPCLGALSSLFRINEPNVVTLVLSLSIGSFLLFRTTLVLYPFSADATFELSTSSE